MTATISRGTTLYTMKSLVRKFFSLIPLTVLAASGVTAGVTQFWWVVPLGFLAASTIAIHSALADAESIPPFTGEAHHDMSQFTSGSRRRFHALLKKKQQILDTLKDLGDSPLLPVDDMAERVNSLVESYYQLLIKLHTILPFVDGKAVDRVKRSVTMLKKQVSQCTDEVTRENFSMALRNKTDELNRLMELEKHSKRIDSQLVTVGTGLNSIHAAILQIKVSPESSGAPAQEIKDRIGQLLLDVDISERVVRELNQVSLDPPVEKQHSSKCQK